MLPARQRIIRWGPRQLDIDIILFGDKRINSDQLQIPHPRFKERMFVLQPLYEAAGDILLPDGEHLSTVIKKCAPGQRVELKYLPEEWLGEIVNDHS